MTSREPVACSDAATAACERGSDLKAAARTLVLSATVLCSLAGAAAHAQEDPPAMLQWFECRWYDMERRMPDYFLSGWGSVWLPPVSRGYVHPLQANQNGFSAGYDPFDRFDLGRPGAQTAYGTEAFFASVVEEFHRCGAKVYIDMVLNHNAGRQTGAGFQADGGYPGFWMAPANPPVNKSPTDNWGDFHNGVASGYYQSENPNGSRYCLLKGDLVALVDINQGSNNQFIRQPVEAGNPQNIPGGLYFNNPDPNNRRFYPDTALGTDSVSNPGTQQPGGAPWAGPLNTGIFAPPCDIPARGEPASVLNFGRFNLADPMAGDPVPENATGYLIRWVQWMLDVHNVDGFRIDAVKHTPSWFFDTYYDSAVYMRRTGPDGQPFTPYSFGESVEGNDFSFDRYVRKPNGRTAGRNAAGDAFGNRDVLDLNGAGALRDLVNNQSWASWGAVQSAHIDNTDDGFNNGNVGVNHCWSHDNGSAGDGGSAPPVPSARQQGWFAHAYMLMKPGMRKTYHNARGVNRSGGFWPRHGVLPALGVEPNVLQARPSPLLPVSAPNTVLTDLVRISNMTGRGYYFPRWTDNEVQVYERSSPLPGGGQSGNVLVGVNRSYAGLNVTSYDQRTFNTTFPAGTRLIELTGNAARADVDPLNQIAEVLTVGAGGSVTIRVPRNQSINGVEHNRGWVIYAPALPAGALEVIGASGEVPVDDVTTASWRRRANPMPIVTGSSITLRLTTTNGDSGAADNSAADDNALFCINAGFQDWNGNGSADVPSSNGVAAGFEQFLTTNQPLYNTANTQGLYEQVIDATHLPEGPNYIRTLAFRKRGTDDAPLFREFRSVIYVDRVAPQAQLTTLGPLPEGTTSFKFLARALDRQTSRVHVIINPSNLSNPPALATAGNLATQDDRFEWSRTAPGLQNGENTILVVAFEDSGNVSWQTYTVFVGTPPAGCDTIDFNGDGLFPDNQDLEDFLSVFGGGPCSTGTCGDIDFNNDGLFPDNTDLEAFFSVFGGGNC